MPISPSQRWMPSEGGNGTTTGNENNPPPPAAECAYQCEVCNNAVFATFKACADHEEECAKKHNEKVEGVDAPQDHGEEKQTPKASPTTQKKEEKEKRDAAVEAVLKLKTGSEGGEA